MNIKTAEAILGRKFWQTKKFQITAVGLTLALLMSGLTFWMSGGDVQASINVFGIVAAAFGINVMAQGRSDETKEAKAVEVTAGNPALTDEKVAKLLAMVELAAETVEKARAITDEEAKSE